MPWLDDLRSKTGISSNRKLAGKMLEHGAWPDGEQISVAALSNQLNLANRGERLEWWLDGRGQPFFPVLAATLDVTELRLREAFAEAGGVPANRGDVFRFNDFPDLKPIDLRTEGLPPWLPPALKRAVHGTWWHAPSGSGRTLVGQWLHTRKGVVFLQAERWGEVAGKLPVEGTVYIELTQAEGVPDLTELELSHPELDVVVACPEAVGARGPAAGSSDPGAVGQDAAEPQNDLESTADEGANDGNWNEVRLGNRHRPDSWVPRVIDWVEERLLPGGGLEVERFWEAYQAGSMAEYVSTPGDLIQLMGLFDVVGTDRLLTEGGDDTGSRILRAWWNSVRERVGRAAPDLLAAIEDAGPRLMIEAEAARLAQGLGACLDTETWAGLLPAHLVQPPVGPDIVAALQSDDPKRRVEAITALRKSSPADFVVAMRKGGVLRSSAGGLSIGPRFVADILRQAAFSLLLEENPLGLGKPLLDSLHSGDTMATLVDAAVDARWNCLLRASEAADTDTAEGAALLDGLVRAVGWVALQPDGPPVPVALCRALWHAQQPLLISRWTRRLPQPMLQVGRDATDEEPLTRSYIWPLCRLGLSHTIASAGVALPPAADNPWAEPLDDGQREMLASALSDGASVLRSARGRFQHIVSLSPEHEVMLAVLGSRLYDQLGVLRTHRFLDECQGCAVLCEAAAGRLAPEEIELAKEAAVRTPFPLDAVEQVARLRGVPLEAVLGWASRWWGAGQGTGPLFELPERSNSANPTDPQVTRRLWEAVPPEHFTPTLCAAIDRLTSVWPWLSDAQWAVVLDHLKEKWWMGLGQAPAGMLGHTPPAIVASLVREFLETPYPASFYGPVWEAHPDVVMGLLPEIIAAPPPAADFLSHLARALSAAPASHTECLVARVRSWLEAPQLAPGVDPWELRRWLAFVIEARRPGWREAWEALRPEG